MLYNTLVVTKKLPGSPGRRMDGISRSRKWLPLAVILFLLLIMWPIAPEETAADQWIYSAHNHSTGAGQGIGGEVKAGISAGEVLLYGIRFSYYTTLLLASGLMLLSLAVRAGQSDTQRQYLNQWSLNAVRAHLLTSLAFVFVHANEIVRNLGGGEAEQWLRLFRDTAVGNAWVALLAASLLGFIALRMKDGFKAVWALLPLAAESYNGHALSSEIKTAAVAFDLVHLVCAALWAGGVFFLLLLWHKSRMEAAKFAFRFTAIAWMSIAALAVSGIAMTALILPSWRYLLYTNWGNWLLVKSLFVLGVIGLGALLRSKAKKRELPAGGLLKLDGLLVLIIVVTVSVLTYISPEPNTTPLKFHEMGDELHYTIAISPNAPGPNEVSLKIWLPEQLGEPTDISLRFVSNGKSSKEIEIPLQNAQLERDDSFPGFTEFNYAAPAPIDLPFPGEWRAELAITDKTGTIERRSVPFSNK